MARRGVFVGREPELALLARALSEDVRLVLVVGDAGIGKTRFAAEGMSLAAAAGMLTVRGECLPLAATLPMLPVTSALRELARLDGGAVMESALTALPGFARQEVGRLLPQLATDDGGSSSAEWSDQWLRGRLFAGVADLLGEVAKQAQAGLGLLIEDVHWADSETLDFLTFLYKTGLQDAVSIVVTCRADEALPPEVAGWLAQVRSAAGTKEVRLGGLSRAQVAGQAAALAGGSVTSDVVDDLFIRAEGNPFFTEQLVTAALTSFAPDDQLRVPTELPHRLTDVLLARAAKSEGDARALLNSMAVMGRPAGEDLLAAVTGLGIEATMRALDELSRARLLADVDPGQGHRPRHALLAEAVSGGLLPAQRLLLHERTAQALTAMGADAVAAEAAEHWQAARRPASELQSRIAAARTAERIFGHAEAAAHWQRAIRLWPDVPNAAEVAGKTLCWVYVRAVDALHNSGDSEHAGELAEHAYREFADHEDLTTAAIAHHRAAFFRALNAPAAGRALLERALALFDQTPPSAEHAAARFDYAVSFLLSADDGDQVVVLLNRALAMADAAGATGLVPRILALLAHVNCMSGRVEEGQALLARAHALAGASEDGMAVLRVAVGDSDAQVKLARFRRAADEGIRGLEVARQSGLEDSWQASMLTANTAEALLALGCTGEAFALIGPLTADPPDLDHWVVHRARAEIDLLQGDIDAATLRRDQIRACVGPNQQVELARESAQQAAELALWVGAPGDALTEVRQVLSLFEVPDWTIFCGRLLAAGMRACADLAEQARARGDRHGAEDAVAAGDGLADWVQQMGGAPFADHPFAAAIPGERATWEAERARLAGSNDPETWARAAKIWDGLGYPHRAGYAWWRQAQAQLEEGQPSTAAAGALRAAAGAADGHQPLLAQVRALAERARIPLQSQDVVTLSTSPPADANTQYGLTPRELAVLRLVGTGKTNAQIGAELFISQRTAGVHVTNILRKLGVSGRVQAAALAERAGLLDP